MSQAFEVTVLRQACSTLYYNGAASSVVAALRDVTHLIDQSQWRPGLPQLLVDLRVHRPEHTIHMLSPASGLSLSVASGLEAEVNRKVYSFGVLFGILTLSL